MELRVQLEVVSTWETSTHLKNILYISNNSGVVLDEPVQSEKCTSLTLSQPAQQEGEGPACFIHIKMLSRLGGYTVTGLELQSVSRTIELYSNGDYVATSKGSLLEDNQGEKLYCCRLELPTEELSSCDHLSLKLLSLKGKTVVPVSRLTVNITEDYGGTIRVDEMSQSQPADLQDLVNSLPIPSNAPPFLVGLISSLQQWQESTTARANANPLSNNSGKDESSQQPVDILQMMTAFRQIKPVSSTPAANTDTVDEQHSRGEQAADSQEDKGCVVESTEHTSVPLSDIEAIIDQKMRELEKRMQSYIDAKVDAIMNHIEMKSVPAYTGK